MAALLLAGPASGQGTAGPGGAPGGEEKGQDAAPRFAGLDEAVNERLAREAGAPARDPYLDLESLGDIWNAILLLAGGACGFVIGRWWHCLWGGRGNEAGACAVRREGSEPAGTGAGGEGGRADA